MRTAVCVYVRNEADDIIEWIAYNIAIGFDTVIVMDNLSEDGTHAAAKLCGAGHDVRLETWSDTSREAQRHCYDHVLRHYGAEFDWIAFIDSDEFIVPVRDVTIKAFLQTLPDAAAVGLNWATFGANGHDRRPDGLILENFIRRAPADFPSNRHVKSIVRPGLTSSNIHPHLFLLSSGPPDDGRRQGYIDASGRPVQWSGTPGIIAGMPDLSICRVNHYYTRSREHFRRKIQRKRWRDPRRAQEEFAYNDRNDAEDLVALRYVAKVRALMRAIAARSPAAPAQAHVPRYAPPYGALPVLPGRFRPMGGSR